MKQRDLYDELPGYPGGRALRDARGRDYYRQIGAKGGATTAARYGHAYMRNLGEWGRAGQVVKRYTQIRTEADWTGTTYRVIPYRPAGSKKRYPDLVKIEQEESC